MTVAPGVVAPQVAGAVPANVGVTITPFAEAPPATAVFRTLAISVTACPALTVADGWAAYVTASPAAAWTVVAGLVVTAAVSGRPVFAAVPLAVAVKAMVPAPDGVQVKVKGTVAPAAMAVAPGLAAVQVAVTPVPAPVAVTVTPLAAAPPRAFYTLTVSATGWPEVTGLVGWAA